MTQARAAVLRFFAVFVGVYGLEIVTLHASTWKDLLGAVVPAIVLAAEKLITRSPSPDPGTLTRTA